MAKNRVTLEGFIRKIELRYTPSQTPVLNIKVPIDRRKKNRDTGEWETENTTWWQLTTFGDDAQYQAERLKEGDYLYFSGMPEVEKSQGKDSREYFNPVMKFPDLAVGLKAPREQSGGRPQGGQQGGFGQQSQQPQNDPWGQQGAIDSSQWGNGANTSGGGGAYDGNAPY